MTNQPMRSQVSIYTDGACSGNPGVGGYAALLEAQGKSREVSGAEAQTTNNRMELMAVIVALELLKRPCLVDIYSDSTYVVHAFTQHWIEGWQKRAWRNSAGQAVSNQDLWQRLLKAAAPHEIRWHKVKGHADDWRNNRCDELAVAAAAALKAEMKANA